MVNGKAIAKTTILIFNVTTVNQLQNLNILFIINYINTNSEFTRLLNKLCIPLIKPFLFREKEALYFRFVRYSS